MTDQTNWPTYHAPPLVEVAMSVQFEPPRRINEAHFGAFWSTLKADFPNVRSTQPIASAVEDFGSEGQWLPPSLQLALSDEPQVRLQMVSSDDQWMCQIQRDRLVVNWRKRDEDYPRFGAPLDHFRNVWRAWTAFLQKEKLFPVVPRMWQLTYVNQIPKGDLWTTPADWPKVFPGLWGGNFLSLDGLELRGLRGQWVWDTCDGSARLYVETKPSRFQKNEVLLVSLTARGSEWLAGQDSTDENEEGELARMERGMNVGHKLIVHSFDALASPTAKKHWDKK